MTPVPIIRFAGRVTCSIGCGPLGLTLMGRTLDEAGVTRLSFNCSAPAQFPSTLDNASVQQVPPPPPAQHTPPVSPVSPVSPMPPAPQRQPRHYRIAADAGEWLLQAQAIHVHRDVGEAFHAAVPPRRVPLPKRLFWRVILLFAASAPGRCLLARRERRAA